MKTSKSPLMRSALFGVLLGSHVFVASALAQTSTTTGDSRSTTSGTQVRDDRPAAGDMKNDKASRLSWGDKRFLNKAAKSGAEEVAVSRIAQERATNPKVKEMARKIVSDHEKMNSDLMALAAAQQVSLPDDLAKQDDKLMSRWQKKEMGADFDKEYVKQMVRDHEDAIELFGTAAKSEDPQIAALAGKALPKLQEHYTHAKELEKTLR